MQAASNFHFAFRAVTKTDDSERFSLAPRAMCMSTPAHATVPPTRSAAAKAVLGWPVASGITSAAPGIILVVAALSLIHCQTFGGNDDEHMRWGSSAA